MQTFEYSTFPTHYLIYVSTNVNTLRDNKNSSLRSIMPFTKNMY